MLSRRLGGADGQADVVAGFAVVGGVRVVRDKDSVADVDAVFGEDSCERGDGGRVRFGLACFARAGGVQGKDNARRAGVASEIAADSAGVGEFRSGLAGEVDAEGGADLALVEGDTDEALVGARILGCDR